MCGGEACLDCGNWEEQIYWTHFQYTQFSKLLQPGFDRSLALPEQFSRHMRKKLPGIVALKGPSGLAWTVELMALGDILHFTHGWDDFVKDHCLREKDLLVFKYDGDSSFDVLMFNGCNLCEMPASYFARKCMNVKRKTGDSCFEVMHDSDRQIGQGTSNRSPDGKPIFSQTSCRGTWCHAKNKAFNSTGINRAKSTEEPSPYHEGLETKPGPGAVRIPHGSSRGLVTEKDKSKALKLAQAAISRKGFIIVMKPNRLAGNGKYHAPVPKGWFASNICSQEKREVILRVNDQTWLTKFSYRNSERNAGSFCGGWKNFVRDNYLQESDVCAFEPGTPENNSLVLEVRIFRVLQRLA